MGKIYQLMYFTKKSGKDVQTVFSTSDKDKYEQQLTTLKNRGVEATLSFISNENEEYFGDVNERYQTIMLN